MRETNNRLVQVTVTVVVQLLLGSAAQAQSRVDWSIHLNLSGDATSTGQVVFREGESFAFELRVKNDEESSSAVVLDERFIRRVELTLRDEADRVVAVNSGWAPEASCARVKECQPVDLRMTLGPDDMAVFHGTLVGVNGTFVPDGRYRVQVSMATARRFVLNEDLSPWRGRGLIDYGVPLTIKTPITRDEVTRVALQNARRAMANGDPASALRTYQTIIKSDPDNRLPLTNVALTGTGEALLALRRFAEAVVVLERVVPPGAVIGPETQSAASLAFAYVVLGQDAKAEALVRRSHGPARVAEVMKALRGTASGVRERR